MGFLLGSKPTVQRANLLTDSQSDLFMGMENILLRALGAPESVLAAATPDRGAFGPPQGVPAYPGTYTPGPSGTQQQIFDLVEELLGGRGPMQKDATGVLTGMMNLADPSAATDYWNKAIKAPMMESWQEDIVPQVMEQFAAYDAGGSGPARKAVAESGRRLETDMGGMLEQYLNQLRGEAYTGAKTGLSYPETLLSTVLPAAATERQISAEQLFEPYQDWLYSQPYNNPWLKYFLPITQQQTFENVRMPGQQGILSDLLGAGSQVARAWIGRPGGASSGVWQDAWNSPAAGAFIPGSFLA